MRRFGAWVINCKRRIDGSLTAKSFLMTLALLLTACTTVYGLLILFLPVTGEQRMRGQLDARAKALVSELRQISAPESGALFARFIQETGAGLTLMGADGQPLDLFTLSAAASETEDGPRYPFRFAGSDAEYVLTVRFDTARSGPIFEGIRHSLPWVAGLIAVLSVSGAFFYSRYATRPVVRMGRIAARIAALDFSWYCPDLREDEIGGLAKSLNELSDKLNTALSVLRRQNIRLEDEIQLEKERERRRLLFFSAVSHEFKTPIAIVLGQLEGMLAGIGVYRDREKYLARSAEILRSLDGLLKEILSVSHMELTGRWRPADLSAIVEAALDDCRPLLEARAQALAAEIAPGILFTGDGALLKKALGNVIANASAYSPHGAAVSVRLAREGGQAALEVANGGVTIAEEQLPHLFEAFFRADRNTGSGSGLGLYITRTVLDAHGVPHTLENAAGGGVKFTAVFNC